jgi:hypothetical protein
LLLRSLLLLQLFLLSLFFDLSAVLRHLVALQLEGVLLQLPALVVVLGDVLLHHARVFVGLNEIVVHRMAVCLVLSSNPVLLKSKRIISVNNLSRAPSELLVANLPDKVALRLFELFEFGLLTAEHTLAKLIETLFLGLALVFTLLPLEFLYLLLFELELLLDGLLC